MAAASVCLLVEGAMPEGIYLPSKLPDYVRASKPVIALSPKIGTVADLTPSRGVTLAAVDDPAAIENALARHYDAFVRGTLATLAPDESLRQEYDGSRIARCLRDLCTELSARRPR
jgi:hypothetical protein